MSVLFTPASIGPVEVPNRFVHSATCECTAAPDGKVTEELIRRYRTLAKGEVGLIIPGHLFVHETGKAFSRQTGIHGDETVEGLSRLVDAVHEHGAKIAFQISHGGRQCPKKVTGATPMAPSGFGVDPSSLNRPRAMTKQDIAFTVQCFALAAERAARAGTDAVQIHAAHGYLASEFLSPFFNRRKDEYGGSADNRFRFLGEVIAAVRSALPDNIPVMIKINGADYTPAAGITPELAAKNAVMAAEAGVAAVEVSSGTYYTFNTVMGSVPDREIAMAHPWWMRPAVRLKLRLSADRFKFSEGFNMTGHTAVREALELQFSGDSQEKPKRPALMAVGGMRRTRQMEEVIESGRADFISMSRPFIREPLLVKTIREKKTDRASCVSCNLCFAAIYNDLPARCYEKTGLFVK